MFSNWLHYVSGPPNTNDFSLSLSLVLTGWETNNQYVVKNSLGQQVFLAAEDSDFCSRMVCGPVRSFMLHIQDNMGQEVMTLSRPLKCSSCFFPCCLQEVKYHTAWCISCNYTVLHFFLFTLDEKMRDRRNITKYYVIAFDNLCTTLNTYKYI